MASYNMEKKEIVSFVERLGFYVIVGMIVGARLGDLLFYQSWSSHLHDPLALFKFWEGGLASHGAIAGIIGAVFLFLKKMRRKFPMINWSSLLDLMVIPGCLAAVFIRIGNFINQEIIGIVTSVPWAVIFGHAADGSLPAPRHPVQLYESFFYLFLTLLLWRLHKKGHGRSISGLFFISLFSFRFLIEFFKAKQSALLSATALLDMGQILSIPFILFGLFLYLKTGKRKCIGQIERK